MGKVTEYAQFTKLRLSSLVVFSAIIGYVIAIEELQRDASWLEMSMLFLGGFLVTGASNGYNQVIEREYDKLMPRTATRPIPTEKMSVREGIIVATLLAIIGTGLLYFFVNPLSAILGLAALLLYVFVYTPMKRVSPFAVFVGAFPGAIPPLLGCVAATEGFGSVPLIGWIMFTGQFMWQFPHFWAIAWVLDEDYRKAGFRMLPSAGGRDKSSAFQVVVYTLFLYPISLMPVMFHFSGMVSSVIISFCSIFFLYQAYILYKECTVEAARKLMFGSFFYLPAIQLAVLYG
jgi:protoheme IX farnesyltransferase